MNRNTVAAALLLVHCLVLGYLKTDIILRNNEES